MNRTSWLGALAVASVLMTGCAASAADSPQTPAPAASHTMADGSMMSGSEHGEHNTVETSAPAAEVVQGPSEAARMVCSGQVVENVTGIFGLDAAPTPSSSWAEPVFTCTYELDGDALVLSVHDDTDATEGTKYFAGLRAGFAEAEDLKGMFALGMPAFSTGDGTVAFLKDGKTLQVDATELKSELGPEGDMNQSDAAYAVAMAVLACWTDHT